MRIRIHLYARPRASTHIARCCALLLACLTLAGLAAAGAAGASFRFGLSDYEPKTFADPRVAELGVHLAREVVPWNVAFKRRDLANVTTWLNAVKHAYHITPFITFQHADNNGRAPTPGQFLTAFRRFRKLFPWVKEFAPWDEATHSTQPTAHNQWLAAAYYNVLAANCRGCEVTPPDIFYSDGNILPCINAS
jgi:hypothetical protein